MIFEIKKKKYYDLISPGSKYYLTDDSSLLYNGLNGDFSIILGGNWRFELLVDSYTGLCTCVQCFLDKIVMGYVDLIIPDFEKGDLFIVDRNQLEYGCGCQYLSINNTVFWDKNRKILCYGDRKCKGDPVEFTLGIIAVINDRQLKCLYLDLSCVNEDKLQLFI